MTPALILFDFDGTLADSFSATLAIANRLAAKYGYPPLSEAEATLLRNQSLRQILRESRVPLRRLPSWMRELKQEQQQEIPKMKPPPGLTEALSELKEQGIPLGIVTSNSRENVRLFLKRNGWDSWFDHLESGSSLFGKARLIKRLLEEISQPPARVFYVGDEERDVEAARRANIRSIAVTWGFNSRDVLARSQPDHLIDRPDQLPHLLRPATL